MLNFRFTFIAFVLCLPLSFVFAQSDPIQGLSVDRVDTRNFEIVVQRSAEPVRPTPKEVGIMAERLCAQLDKIFLKYAPHRVAEELERAQKGDAGGKKPPKDPKEYSADDPNRVIPKCKILIFNNRDDYLAKCVFDGIPAESETLTKGYAGFFTLKTNSIYMNRSWSVQNTRETILHETTHYYTFNFLPGGFRCYPQWFHEGLAMSYEGHYWNGDKLQIGVQQRIQKFDAPGSAIIGLQRFRDYQAIQQAKSGAESPDSSTDPKTTEKKRSAKAPIKKETPIDPALIQPFLDTMFHREDLVKSGVTLKSDTEEISHRYAMYLAFGRYLLAVKPDFLGAVIRQISMWEKENDRTHPRQHWFVEAWKKVAADKPITVEEVGRWVQKNQLPFHWTFGDWQDLGDQIGGKAQEGKISILALRDPKLMPKFTIFPKNLQKFQVGIVINYIDNENFGVVVVDQDGDVLQMEQVRGTWTNSKRIGKTTPLPNRNSPYGNGVSFQFAAAQQGNMIAVQVNKTLAGTYPKNPKGSCGFFLSSTEGIFSY